MLQTVCAQSCFHCFCRAALPVNRICGITRSTTGTATRSASNAQLSPLTRSSGYARGPLQCGPFRVRVQCRLRRWRVPPLARSKVHAETPHAFAKRNGPPNPPTQTDTQPCLNRRPCKPCTRKQQNECEKGKKKDANVCRRASHRRKTNA